MAERAILAQRITSADTVDKKQALQLQLLRKDIIIASQKVASNKAKAGDIYRLFADKNYAKQLEILKKLSAATSMEDMGLIAKQFINLPYIKCSPTMGPLLKSITQQAKQLNATVSSVPQRR